MEFPPYYRLHALPPVALDINCPAPQLGIPVPLYTLSGPAALESCRIRDWGTGERGGAVVLGTLCPRAS